MCFNRESDGREKWRFGLDDKNIYTVVRDCDRKIKKIYSRLVLHTVSSTIPHAMSNISVSFSPHTRTSCGEMAPPTITGNDGGKTAALYVCVNVPSALMLAMEPVL